MAKKKTEIQIKFDADTNSFKKDVKNADNEITSFRKELKLNATELKNNSNSIELLSQKQSLLAKESDASKNKIDILTKRLEGAKKAYGDNSEEVRLLQNKLTDAKTQFAAIQNEIQDTDKKIKGLTDSAKDNSDKLQSLDDNANQAGKQMKNLSDDAKKAGDGFTVSKGAIAGFISNGLTALVNKCKEGIQWIAGLADETREFRQDMNTLTTAFDAANFSNETAQNTWKNLYAIFGEDDRAVEAANNISRMAKSEEDLNEWVKITTGIWGTYQDALPVESLAEAAGETAKTAQVTGTLADALNWNSEAAKMFSQYMSDDVTTAEDAFNVALSKCSDEQERQQLITETLTSLYGGAAEKYNETAGSIIEANKATADLTTAQADLGEVVEPITTTLTSGFAGLLTEFTDLLNLDTEGISNGISQAFNDFQNNILPEITDGLGWINDNSDYIIAGVSGIGTAFAVWKAASIISGVIAAMNGLSAAQIIAAAKQWLLNVAMNANPIGIIIALIAGLVTAFVVLWNKSDSFRNFWINLWDNIKEKAGSVVDWFKSIPETIGNLFERLKNKVKVPKINVTYSTDGTLGKVAEAIGLPGFPKLNVTWNKDGHFFTGKTLEVRGYAEAGDSEYALPLNSKTLDPLAAGIVNHMDSSTDLSEVIRYIREVHNEIRTGNLTIEDKFIDAVANRLKLMLNDRELGRVVRKF